MKIAVLGAGAQGSMFGGFLARKEDDLWLLDTRKTHIDAIKERGLVMTKGSQKEVVYPNATVDPSEVGPVDLIVLQVKGFDTRQAMMDGRPMIDDRTLVMTLQNGIGNAEQIAEVVDENRIIVGVTTIGAAVTAPGSIELTDAAYEGRGSTDFGFWRAKDSGRLKDIERRFREAGIAANAVDRIHEIIFYKLAMAASMASLSAIGRLYIHHVIEPEVGVDLIRDITEETVRIANAQGIPITFDGAFERGMTSFRHSSGHITSMCSDVLHQRKTEVDSLNGAIVREGKRLGIATPVNETITRLVKLIESNFSNQLLEPPVS